MSRHRKLCAVIAGATANAKVRDAIRSRKFAQLSRNQWIPMCFTRYLTNDEAPEHVRLRLDELEQLQMQK